MKTLLLSLLLFIPSAFAGDRTIQLTENECVEVAVGVAKSVSDPKFSTKKFTKNSQTVIQFILDNNDKKALKAIDPVQIASGLYQGCMEANGSTAVPEPI